jgi:hypothetical protein
MSPEIHLPETILGMDEPLGYKQVVGVAGVDVGNAIFIPVDGDFIPQVG